MIRWVWRLALGTVVFDFDSTLIQKESLEEILAPKFVGKPELEEQVRSITNQGMEGTISFQESLSRRLALASPSLEEVRRFGESATALLSPGVARLITALVKGGIAVKIASGGLREAILPVAQSMGIPDGDVGAVSLQWQSNGAFAQLNPEDRFSHSKIDGVRPLLPSWSRPVIVVGDGMADYDLFRHGLVDHFIAYTEWARRVSVLATGAPEAKNMEVLANLLEDLLHAPPDKR